ncbi:SHOCT domain-containing protein [Cohnella sp. WQ 127256]|uniref:SHOCT domain-containing protein n=1 Tax=Cohnella sp. WQ 127256 TaxID=2938790 RepID=UPI002117E7CF|nr:SHOCT domain-containing protein [Cohnella sp. WQ 127256]
MKVMSIIGIVWFSLCLIFILGLAASDNAESAAGWGMLGLFYALPFSIVALVKSLGNTKPIANVHDQLLKLNELKEKNIITEEDFNKKKDVLLTQYS